MIEKIIFNVLAFTLFLLIFFNLIRKNDTNYLYLLLIQFMGIFINFLELIINVMLNSSIRVLIYIISVVLPILILLLENIKGISFTEILDISLVKMYVLLKEDFKAEKRLKDLLSKYPNSKIGYKKLAELYERKGKKELAIEQYQNLTELDTKNIEIYLKIGNLYYECNKNKEAKELYVQILNNNPESYKASMMLAEILYEYGEYKEAIQVYSMALKYNPTNYDLYYNMGMTYTMLNDFQKAKENYEKAAKINSDLYHARYTIGQLNLIFGELDEAEKDFTQCLNSEEEEAGSYYYLAMIAIIKGESEKAINYANIAIEDDPGIYIKIQEENMFITIRDKIKKPDLEIESNNNKFKLNEKEIKIDKHLESTFKLVGKLNNNDIQMIENVMKINDEKITIKKESDREKE